MAVAVVVVGAVAGDERAFKGGEGFADVDEGVGTAITWKGFVKELFVGRVGSDGLKEFVVLGMQAKLDGVVVEERRDGLIFELGDGGIGPVEDSEPGYVGQRHDAACVELAGDSHGYRELVGKTVFLDVAGGARALAIDRHAQVVEEMAAQLDFGG